MRGRVRKKQIIVIALGAAGALVVLLVLWIGASAVSKAKWQGEKAKYEQALSQHVQNLSLYETKTRAGYVLIVPKSAGDAIAETDVEKRALPDYFTPEDVIALPEQVIGKVMKLNGKPGTALTSEMVYDQEQLDPSLRKEEAQYIRLPIRVQPLDIVDIRIVFPNGEDYIVLSKKKLDDVDAGNQLSYFTVNEEERQLLQSALVDAYTNKAELYGIQYVEPELQPKAVVTYTPNLDVMKVLRSNPNIVAKAKLSLNEGLRSELDTRLSKIPEGSRQRIGTDAPDGGAVSKRKETIETLLPPASEVAAPPVQETGTAPAAGNEAAATGDSGLLEGNAR
ncbi:SAF domain-containing protein [Paenibacillus sp. L3-i20]|uniref:SAF domain-containing protein n=1 Tax=Paenibacillus sp. L3-i20 TaxID=2905833 RepID=UPI001EDDB65E|nr:SAF domain-containing protein [Paenibacillus sp. L3-i20]GKU78126.1 hypothetical protein L3i20_v225230 [Paenibacillus sp. L3-i20]